MAPPPHMSYRAAEVFSVFSACLSTRRTDMGQTVGLDRGAVRDLAEKDMHIPLDVEWWDLFSCIEEGHRAAEAEAMKKAAAEREAERG